MYNSIHEITASGKGGSAVFGWMIQRQTPTNREIRNWGGGLTISASLIFGGGGGFTFSPSQPMTPGVYFGVGVSIGGGGSFGYEANR